MSRYYPSYQYHIDDHEVFEALDRFGTAATRFLVMGVGDVVQFVTATATSSKYMMTTPGGGANKRLGMRTTRLARSIIGAAFFGVIGETGKVAPGSFDSIRELTINGNTITAKIGTLVPYAATHEFGRGGFPKRAYLTPALMEAENGIAQQFFEQRLKQLEKHLSRGGGE